MDSGRTTDGKALLRCTRLVVGFFRLFELKPGGKQQFLLSGAGEDPKIHFPLSLLLCTPHLALRSPRTPETP